MREMPVIIARKPEEFTPKHKSISSGRLKANTATSLRLQGQKTRVHSACPSGIFWPGPCAVTSPRLPVAPSDYSKYLKSSSISRPLYGHFPGSGQSVRRLTGGPSGYCGPMRVYGPGAVCPWGPYSSCLGAVFFPAGNCGPCGRLGPWGCAACPHCGYGCWNPYGCGCGYGCCGACCRGGCGCCLPGGPFCCCCCMASIPACGEGRPHDAQQTPSLPSDTEVDETSDK